MNQGLEWLDVPAAALDEAAGAAALARQQVLTKPRGSLGRLEELAVRLAAMQGTERPRAERIAIVVFAGDHGVAAEGISAFPQSVTAEMIKNFARGGAGISVAARALGATMEIVDLGTVVDPGALAGVVRCDLGPGTANFVAGPAMDEHQCARALAAGRHAAERARLAGADLFIGGEMGIGNTTVSAGLASALLSLDPEALAGPGTGLDAGGIAHKVAVLRRALAHHRDHLDDPREALRRLGGFEIAALAGSYIACAQMGLPVLVDGFISSTAALAATRLHPGTRDWLILTHASAEPGHRRVVEALDARPLLDLGMRLGEGSGAAVAVPLLRMACALHNEMATFAEAEVSPQM
ncbi:nicotinate-nucleotide--dimethylbenzimidazole phosphoribosyltransferase [Thiococcus pfennigii]|uniref:nicotinate-nucleotide--dimethylbenzimidazole phosphoribosyltransferase n=1 Tax=Thiococcus pfennigii TaxID=1057 RepID=UPI001903889A|nr:nicotinate-nucleotide--dimethylbenzimidazole phosphoribosyltransferase [Thiococcus pfennigii]